MTAGTSAGQRSTVNGQRSAQLPLVLAVLATALNLRIAVASVPPLIDELRSAVPLSGAAAGVLTTLPVVCMAVGATMVPRLSRRFGHELPLVLVGISMAAGMLVRVAPGVVFLYLGTTIAGIGVALGNVLVPSLVKRDFPDRVGYMTGIYTMAISVSAGIAGGLTVPIENLIGHGWRPALAVWALPAFVCGLVWIPFARHPTAVADRRAPAPRTSSRLLHDRLAWQVTLFMGVQSLMFYSLLSWLPSIFQDDGVSKGTSGAYLSIYTLLGIPICFAVPVIAERMRDQRSLITVSVLSLAGGIVGLIVAPTGGAILWSVLTGIAQAGTLSLVFLFFVLRTHTQSEAAELSSMAQSIGYGMAALGPVVMGALHEATGSWTAPLWFLLVLTVPELIFGLQAARDKQVGAH